ncbi:plastocyanin/azurin family copper-binding protein [Fodinibius sp.]|uniref:plastocyanin/azurin family copper-binding protein n=1 Tax=Fodinibius sp. TaxID=1872440 RepID=UPI002ACD272B|nr:plastocyanin/azurin family copper-binding protein [Fodinibius sp.]MDZ7657699.1 plastocyanin/azurin family copper-binding protein [Fodinibius sp.]
MMKFSVVILLITFVTIIGWKDTIAVDVSQADTVTVEVKGTDGDARFDPVVVAVNPGDVIQFLVREGLHTVTAYHPENRRPKRIPLSAKPFDSGLMEQGDEWLLTISEEGVYDYFCLPHEKIGHVGRIIAGSLDAAEDYPDEGMPKAALTKLKEETEIFLNQ